MLLAKPNNRLNMGFKCAVVGCKTGYSSGPQRPLFQFPEKDTLRAKWIEFVNRKYFFVTLSSRICIFHFESTYLSLSLCKDRARLNYSLHPIPTIHPMSIAKSQSVIPNRVRKSPTLHIYNSIKALCTLRNNSLIGNDVVILLDEMYLKLKSNSMEKV